MSEELVQYYVINRELGMSPGKIAAQAAHAAVCATLDLIRPESPRHAENFGRFAEWAQGGMAKVVLVGDESELKKLEAEGFYAIRDSGRTEIAPGSLTVVCLPPMPKREARKWVGHLKLL